jgi:Transposase zinc-ribbon domain
MSEALITALSGIRTVEDMTGVFGDEERCRRLLEAMVWPNGRVCPACGYRHSVALAGRDTGKFRARPGLYQCSNGDCRFQFTVTTRTPLHSTKLPLGTGSRRCGLSSSRTRDCRLCVWPKQLA